MPGVGKAIKNRIKSVTNTKKITKAMELVAAAKMRKAIASSLSSRLYAQHAWELLQNLATEQNLQHPLLTAGKEKNELILVISSNRGLCGSYNANVNKAVLQYTKHNNNNIDLITVGKKAEKIARLTNKKIIASFIEFSENITVGEISGLSKIIIDEFSQDKYSKVTIVYTDFVSSIKYEPRIKPLLPINEENLAELINENTDKVKSSDTRFNPLILFEPNEESVLDLVLPRLTEVQIYQALLEAAASEHSARMMAMKSASDNAEGMLKDLMLYYNQARQASITQEIAEISSGAEALK